VRCCVAAAVEENHGVGGLIACGGREDDWLLLFRRSLSHGDDYYAAGASGCLDCFTGSLRLVGREVRWVGRQ
jgi:hypothetical protein